MDKGPEFAWLVVSTRGKIYHALFVSELFLRSELNLLDEPLSNLDSVVADKIMKSLVTDSSYASQTFLITTSDHRHIKYCRRVAYM